MPARSGRVARVSAGIATSDPHAPPPPEPTCSRYGATAADATVAAALVLYVVEPQSCGPGGDAFLIHVDQAAIGRARGSGRCRRRWTTPLSAAGLDTIPARGAAWPPYRARCACWKTRSPSSAHARWRELAQPALDLARRGFEVRPTLATAAARAAAEIGDDPVLGPLYVPAASRSRPGTRSSIPCSPIVSRRSARTASHVLHHGDAGVGRRRSFRAGGGFLTEEDFAAHTTPPIELVATTFRDSTVWELSPPTQGIS